MTSLVASDCFLLDEELPSEFVLRRFYDFPEFPEPFYPKRCHSPVPSLPRSNSTSSFVELMADDEENDDEDERSDEDSDETVQARESTDEEEDDDEEKWPIGGEEHPKNANLLSVPDIMVMDHEVDNINLVKQCQHLSDQTGDALEDTVVSAMDRPQSVLLLVVLIHIIVSTMIAELLSSWSASPASNDVVLGMSLCSVILCAVPLLFYIREHSMRIRSEVLLAKIDTSK